MHDIAKGRMEDDRRSAPGSHGSFRFRMGLNPAEADTATWLVEHHLAMSTAQSRDL